MRDAFLRDFLEAAVNRAAKGRGLSHIGATTFEGEAQSFPRQLARQAGHIVMTNGRTRLVIPRHNPINAFTMGGLAKTAGLTPEQFKELL